MKMIYKNWITSIMGLMLIALGGFMLWFEKDTVAITLSFATGVGLVFSKDDLITKFLGK